VSPIISPANIIAHSYIQCVNQKNSLKGISFYTQPLVDTPPYNWTIGERYKDEFGMTHIGLDTIYNEYNDQYLLDIYFTGGAHCCVWIDIYWFNEDINGYEYIARFKRDGDPYFRGYPFYVSDDYPYFYTYGTTSYGEGVCSEKARLCHKLKEDNFYLTIEGNKESYIDCVKDEFKLMKIHDLDENNKDYGDRLKILKTLYRLKIAGVPNTTLKKLYESIPDFEGKTKLWIDIKSRLGI
jgi:hypothetical protein